MTTSQLLRRNLLYFWRTNSAVVVGVAVAVGVLTGALLVGDSVRGSLRELFLSRIGNTGTVVVANHFFEETLAEGLDAGAVPVIAFGGALIREETGARRNDVRVYGVDERFWAFHELAAPSLSGREALITPSLARELESLPGDALLLRVEQPSAVARSSLHGIKDDPGRTLRMTLGADVPLDFALFPAQDLVYAVFVPLTRLQSDLGEDARVNTILVDSETPAAAVTDLLRERASLEDMGVRIRQLESDSRTIIIEAEALMLSDPVARAALETADALELRTTSALTYLANGLRIGERETPYSLVTALSETAYRTLLEGDRPMSPSLLLNSWAAADLSAVKGDALTMTYFVWEDDGGIQTETADFIVDGIVPMTGLAGDPDLAPEYPGISETEDLADWDPPFPLDLSRVRDKDEAYWDEHRTIPKAFIRLTRGQRLWPVQQGKLTSIRMTGEQTLSGVADSLRGRLDPLTLGFTVFPAREEGLDASRGATDFGEYFVYFSYFLMVAALLLTGLFFKLGVEQRLREVGTLRAVGFSMKDVRKLFLAEGVALSMLGGALGAGVAILYGWVVMYGLRTWWVDAVGTRLLSLHVGPGSVVLGLVSGVAVAVFSIWLTLRHLQKMSPRSLLGGDVRAASLPSRRAGRNARRIGVVAFGTGILLLGLASFGVVPEVVAFMVAGNLLLVALVVFQWAWLSSTERRTLHGTGVSAMLRLGFRNASDRPGRSLVAIALIAFATFTIVAVEAFRKSDEAPAVDRSSGTGGFALVGESLLPFHWDPNSEDGRDALNLPFEGDADALPMSIRTFRLRDGEDASCLNLYRPQNPRVLSASDAFVAEGRFQFRSTIQASAEERDNPWLLLRRSFPDGAVPVIGDANSMAYVLHLGLGEDFLLPRVGENPLRLRLVATLADSIFQGELLMAESAFKVNFPRVDGFRFFLAESSRAGALARQLEERMQDFGVDVTTTADKLASFHRVENTYLSTFQTLGGLGLVLGTFGLASVLWRNILERRRELALLRAVGYDRKDFSWMIVAETTFLLGLGLLTGATASLIAIAPAIMSKGAGFGEGAIGPLLVAVFVSGVASALVAVGAISRAPLLSQLRSE